MGGSTGSGDDGFEPALGCQLGVNEHIVGHAVGRKYPGFEADAKLLENIDCVLHGLPIGVGTHDDAYLNSFHR